MGKSAPRLFILALGSIWTLGVTGIAQAGAITFFNSTPIAIPATGDSGAGAPYPSPIVVSGISAGNSVAVIATVYGLTHTSIADIGMLLVGPGGQSVVLMDFVGSGEVDDATYSFADAASDYLPFAGAPPSGTYLPTGYDPFGNILAQPDTFDPPAPSSGYSSSGLSVFQGLDPNGTWNLFVEDFLPVDSGVLAGGWSLTVITAPVPEPSGYLFLGTGALLLLFLSKRRSAFAFGCVLCAAPVAQAQALNPLPGSPFGFPSPPAGQNSNVALLSMDGSHMFVSNQDSNTITVLNVAAGGSLSFQGSYVTTPSFSAAGIAANPAGNRLYVATGDRTLNVHSVAADGSLTQVQAADVGTPSTAANGVVYVALSAGDYVYINNNEGPNTVTAFPVRSDGTLATGTVVATGGDGFPLGFYASPRLLAGSDRRLYVLNEASSSISVFTIDPASGNLTPVPGSPFAMPTGADSSGGIAISSNAASLFAATTDGRVIKYAIDPATGSLNILKIGNTGIADGIDGLTVDPTGAYVVGTLFLSQQIAVLNTATMNPVLNSPFVQDGVSVSPTSWGAGVLFNQAGTLLFTSDANYSRTQASSYVFAR